MIESRKVGGIIVLYNPDWNVTNRAIDSLINQVNSLCVVDNTPNVDLSDKFSSAPKVKYIPLKENIGIAAAQNVGIKYFLSLDYDFVLFSDQDSLALNGIAEDLIHAYEVLSQMETVVAVGPQPINKVTNHSYVKEYSILDKSSVGDIPYWDMLYIISSFSLTKLSYFKEFGLFNEHLFIDGVEHEWNWRVKNKINGKIFMLPNLKIEHELGTSAKVLGRESNISSPFRIYYQIRNLLWLSKVSYSPESWIKYNRKKTVLKSFYYPVMCKGHFSYLKSVLKGWRDGLFKYNDFHKF
ncbi:MAG: glycosyltransferase [Muribaculum sp.]|nr:glycosyltransferase [Muribaculum sp.]